MMLKAASSPRHNLPPPLQKKHTKTRRPMHCTHTRSQNARADASRDAEGDAVAVCVHVTGDIGHGLAHNVCWDPACVLDNLSQNRCRIMAQNKCHMKTVLSKADTGTSTGTRTQAPHLDATQHIALGISKRLALLKRDEPRNLALQANKQNKAKQSKTKQSKAKQSKTKQNKAKQNKAKQSKAKQSKAKQNKTKQNKANKTNKQNTHTRSTYANAEAGQPW